MLTTPLISHLSKDTVVDVVATPAALPLLAGNPAIRRVVPYDKRGKDAGIGGLRRLATRVLAEHADGVCYLAQGSVRSAFLALSAGYRQRVGFDTSAGRWLYSRRITHRPDQHHAERLLRLAVGDDAAIDQATLRPRLYPSAQERAAVDELMAAHHVSGEPLIALAPGSVWATKRWPGFPVLAQSLARHGRIVIIGGADDRDLAAGIVSSTTGAIDATGTLSLLASADLIGRCSLLVTNDSLPQHLASAMGTRTVTIFGPTVPGFGFGPLAPRSATAGHESLPCRPCHPHGPAVCPLGHHLCMRDLAAPVVLARALEVLAG